MNILIFFISIILIEICYTQHCKASQSEVLMNVNEEINVQITCSPAATFIDMQTPLPTGISFNPNTGAMTGKPIIHSYLTNYSIVAVMSDVYEQVKFALAVYGNVTKCSYGNEGSFVLYKGQSVNIDGPKCDGPVYKYSIEPGLPEGLSFNQNSGRIYGSVATTEVQKQYHVITHKPPPSDVGITISFNLRVDNPVNLPTGLYTRITPEGYCGNFTDYTPIWDNFDTGDVPISSELVISTPWGTCDHSDCDWPENMNHGHRLNFCMKIVGYIDIPQDDEYSFSLESDDTSHLFIDDLKVPIIRHVTPDQKRVSINKSLKTGLVRFGVLYQQTIGPYHLKVEWKANKIGMTDFGRILPTFFRHDPVPIQNLHYISSHITFVKDYYRIFIPYFHGTPDKFILSGNLPNGITFIPSNGTLLGSSQEIIDYWREIKITAISGSSTSVSVATVFIRSLEISRQSLLAGSNVAVYKPLKYDCYRVPDIHDGYHELYKHIVDDKIVHEISRAPFPYIGFENVSYVIRQYGIMYLPNDATYDFKLESIDGSYIKIDNFQLYNWGCSDGKERHVNSSSYYFKTGYYTFELLYLRVLPHLNFGVELHYKKSDQKDYSEFPGSYVYHVPYGVMQYTIRAESLIVGEKMESPNKIVLFDPPVKQKYTKFSIIPRLPYGLSLNSDNGDIQGTLLTSSQRQTHYMITATSVDESSTISTVITIESRSVNQPTDFKYIFENTTVVPTLVGKIGEKIPTLIPKFVGSAYLYDIVSGMLPIGLVFDRKTGYITGTPEIQSKSSVTISVGNQIGSAYCTIHFDISGCEDGLHYFLFFIMNYDAGIYVDLKHNNTDVLSKYIDTKFQEYHYGGCFDPMEIFQVRIQSQAYRPPYVHIRLNGDTYLYAATLPPFNGQSNITLSIDANLNITKPLLEYPLTRLIYVDVYNEIAPEKIVGGIKEISISPKLPEGLTLSLPGIIRGTPRAASEKQEYTITYSNEAGSDTLKLELEVIVCDGRNVPVEFRIKSQEYAEEMRVEVSKQTGTSVKYLYEGFPDYTTTVYSKCLENGIYTVRLTNINGGRWQPFTLFEIAYIHGVEAFHGTVVDMPVKVDVDLEHIVSLSTNWEYYDGTSIQENWNKPGFNPTPPWAMSTMGRFPLRETTTRYYRFKFYPGMFKYEEATNIVSSFQYDAGIIIYINGNEVFKNNLPPGNVLPNTKATAIFETLQFFRYGFSPSYLLNSENVIAIEVHKHDSSSQYDPFGGYFDVNELEVSPVHFNVYSRGIITNSHPDVPGYPVSYLLDDVYSTMWMADTQYDQGTTITYQYKQHRVEYVNMYVIREGDDRKMDPRSWTLSGSLDGSSWVVLDKQVNQSFSLMGHKTYYYFPNNKSFEQFKLDIHTHGDSKENSVRNRIQMADFLLYATRYKYCPTDGEWQATDIDMGTIYKQCPRGYTGTVPRKCNTDGKWDPKPDWTKFCTKIKPGEIVMDNQDVLTHKNSGMEPIVFYVDAVDVKYTITPSLPKGLVLDDVNGIITGIPKESLAKTYFTVTAKNDIGDSSTNFYLEVTIVYCDESYPFKKTEQGEYAYASCPDGSVGEYKRFCQVGWIPIWLDPENTCKPKSDSNSGQISAGGIVGIVIAAIIVICVVAFIGYRYYIHNNSAIPSSKSRTPDRYKATKV